MRNTNFAAVSPYRLTTHLGSALTIYSLLLWTGLGLLYHRVLYIMCVCVYLYLYLYLYIYI